MCVSPTSTRVVAPFAPSVRAMAAALAPGGVLAIVGLYRHESATDHATTAAALPPQWGIGAGLRMARAITGVPEPLTGNTGMPVRDPDMSLREIAAEAGRLLPGARLRRHLFWRYSMAWTWCGPAHWGTIPPLSPRSPTS